MPLPYYLRAEIDHLLQAVEAGQHPIHYYTDTNPKPVEGGEGILYIDKTNKKLELWDSTTGTYEKLGEDDLQYQDIIDILGFVPASEDHIHEEYLTEFTEEDPTVPQHVKEITATEVENWVTAFNEGIISGSVTGDVNKTITLTKRNGEALTIPFIDNEGTDTDDVLNTINFSKDTGVFTAVTSEGVQITTNLDGRYSLLGHTHTASEIEQDAEHRFVSDTEKNTWNGKQDTLSYTPLDKATFDGTADDLKALIDGIEVPEIVDALNSVDISKGLSANQGRILKGFIDDINTLLQSDDTTLDELQEIVTYIKQNKSDLENLSVENITGLQDALNAKVDTGQVLTPVPENAVFTDTIYNDTEISQRVTDVENNKADDSEVVKQVSVNGGAPQSPTNGLIDLTVEGTGSGGSTGITIENNEFYWSTGDSQTFTTLTEFSKEVVIAVNGQVLMASQYNIDDSQTFTIVDELEDGDAIKIVYIPLTSTDTPPDNGEPDPDSFATFFGDDTISSNETYRTDVAHAWGITPVDGSAVDSSLHDDGLTRYQDYVNDSGKYVVSIGMNDLLDGRSEIAFESNYTSLVEGLLNSYSATDIILTTLMWVDIDDPNYTIVKHEAFNEVIKNTASTYGTQLVDFYVPFIGRTDLLEIDGKTPNSAGFEVLKTQAINYISDSPYESELISYMAATKTPDTDTVVHDVRTGSEVWSFLDQEIKTAKTNGYWDGIISWNPMLGGTAEKYSWNLVDITKYSLEFKGSWAAIEESGNTGDGSTAYAIMSERPYEDSRTGADYRDSDGQENDSIGMTLAYKSIGSDGEYLAGAITRGNQLAFKNEGGELQSEGHGNHPSGFGISNPPTSGVVTTAKFGTQWQIFIDNGTPETVTHIEGQSPANRPMYGGVNGNTNNTQNEDLYYPTTAKLGSQMYHVGDTGKLSAFNQLVQDWENFLNR